MRTKFYFVAALAATMLASCADDKFVGDNSPNVVQNESDRNAINFAFNLQNSTRAPQTGATAAETLGNQFIVWGEKNEAQTNSGTDGKGAATAANLVFQNYQVNYGANTAFTTQSNTENWEYVGYTHSDKYKANITTSAAVGTPAVSTGLADPQTIKYWDFTASNYTFTAVSALRTDIEADNVKIRKNVSNETDVWGKGYTITLTDAADPSKVFIADRKVITKPSPSFTEADRTADNTYGGNVTLTFRNILSHVRVGMFETVPGYTVKIDKFYSVNAANPDFSAMTNGSTTAFTANVPNALTTSAAILDVTYVKEAGARNTPTISISNTTVNNVLTLGSNIPTANLGENAPAALFDKSDKEYTAVFPQEANDKNMKLKVDYTLTSPTGETINVKDATAEVPANYLQWKPNYKYTYLFKISENTNGSTGTPGTDPAGLYPITFDAVVAIAEDGTAEYITTVSEPSITTIGVLGGKYSIGKNEYDASTAVYATVEDGSTLVTLSASNMQLYTVNATSPFLATEAAVAEALIEKPAMTKAQVDLAKIKFPTNPTLTYQKTVPAEDGTTKTLDASLDKAATFTTAASTKYAIVYEKQAATYVWGTGKKYATLEAFNTAKAEAVDGELYTDDQCTTKATAWANADTEYFTANAAKYAGNTEFDNAGNVYAAPGSVASPAASRADDSTPYYKPIKVKSKGTYAIKIITSN